MDPSAVVEGAGTDTGTIPAVLASTATRYADAPALIDGPARLTYAALHERVRAAAGLFIAEGVGAGDRVAVCSPNTQHWVIAALGALYAGATLVPINTRFTGPEMYDVASRSSARALVIAGPFLGVDRLAELRAAAKEHAVAGVDGPVPGLPALRSVLRVPVEPGELPADEQVLDWAALDAQPTPAEQVDRRAAAVRPDDVSDILFTSGTTGRSKGAMSAHRQALGVARAWTDGAGLTAADRYLVINPFFHSFGYKAGILACLLRGAAIVPQAVFNVAETMGLIERERISVLPGAPTIYQSLLGHPDRAKYDLSSLRLAVTGAATVPVVLIERMRTEMAFRTVLTAYGLTEAVVATMCQPTDDAETVSHTCGRATADFELRIADAHGRPLPAGVAGEVQLRGPNVMLGYLDDPEATARTVDADGWLHTGDVGTVDERGYLTITDRLKDMYICGGFNVYPAEIEQALATLDGVADTAVIGVPDSRLGEVGRAYLVTRPDSRLSAEDVLAFCRSRLANYKVPRQVVFRDVLPRNASGKIVKRLLRAEPAEASGPAEAADNTAEASGPAEAADNTAEASGPAEAAAGEPDSEERT